MKNKVSYRPLLHFTPASGFLNDPNGLVYDKKSGTYHVCFQYQKDVNCDLNVCWRHAESKDLFALKEKDTVIFPCESGVAFSGSSVIDENNVSGLFSENGVNIVSFYTVHDLDTKHEYITAAYSSDGKNWIPLARPLIANLNDEYGVNGFRDPKVFRSGSRQEDRWLMITGGGKVRLFASDNLLDWEFQSEIPNVGAADPEIVKQMLILQKYLPDNDPYAEMLIAECPDLFPLQSEDGTVKWIVSGGGLFYIVGDLVRRQGRYEYIPQSPRRTFMRCSNFFAHRGEPYAMQTFFADSSERRIAFSWLMDTTAGETEEKPYNGAFSLPHELSLVRQNGEYYVRIFPLQEMEKLRRQIFGREILDKSEVLSRKKVRLFEVLFRFNSSDTDAFELLFENESNALRFLFRPEEKIMYIDLTRADTFLRHTVEAIRLEECNSIRIIKDVSVLDVYVNNGSQWYSVFTFHEKDSFSVSVRAAGERMKLCGLQLYSLHGVYKSAE